MLGNPEINRLAHKKPGSTFFFVGPQFPSLFSCLKSRLLHHKGVEYTVFDNSSFVILIARKQERNDFVFHSAEDVINHL